MVFRTLSLEKNVRLRKCFVFCSGYFLANLICRNSLVHAFFLNKNKNKYTLTSPAMYAGSLLSHSGHILGSNSMITRNLHHTII